MSDYKSRYKDTFFLQVGKWGSNLTPQEAVKVGILKEQQASPPSSPEDSKVTKVTRSKRDTSK